MRESAWSGLSPLDRYLSRIRAFAETHHGGLVVSQTSAAALHGLPLLPNNPLDTVHAIDTRRTRSRRGRGFVVHTSALAEQDIVILHGLRVTSVARTVLDIASSHTFGEAVSVADGALALHSRNVAGPKLSRDDLLQAWQRVAPFRGYARARKVIQFAEEGAGSPLESLSRVAMHAFGFPRPQLQQPVFDERGRIGFVDFGWPDYEIVAEADGALKYVDARFRGGRSADQVVLDEKDREDRLRAVTRGFARWRWDAVHNPALLRLRLERAGLPTGQPWH